MAVWSLPSKPPAPLSTIGCHSPRLVLHPPTPALLPKVPPAAEDNENTLAAEKPCPTRKRPRLCASSLIIIIIIIIIIIYFSFNNNNKLCVIIIYKYKGNKTR